MPRGVHAKRLTAPPPEDPAMLLVTTSQGVQHVAACCERAERAGVRSGMTLAHARSLLNDTDVHVEPFTPERDAGRLRQLARWALRLAPCVAPDHPDGLLMDITGCERLFGGEHRHLGLIATSFDRIHFPARLTAAPTFGSAWALARYGKERISIIGNESVHAALASLPVAALRLDWEIQIALFEVGITTIGELLDLPREQLAARFGTGILQRIDQVFGRMAEHLDFIEPESPLIVSLTADEPVKQYESIERAVETLLSELLVELTKRDKGVQHFEIVFNRSGSEPQRLSIRLTHASRNRMHLWTLIRPRLECMDISHGVEEVTMKVLRSARLSHEQLAFLPGSGSAQQEAHVSALGELLDQLSARLGREAVCFIEPVQTHVPEHAFVPRGFVTVAAIDRKRPYHEGEPTVVGSRPSRLFAVPDPAQVFSIVPDGPPAWIRWRGREYVVLHSAGPERLALPWWNGSQRAARDYYDVQLPHGGWLWVYRELETGRWFVHGEWA